MPGLLACALVASGGLAGAAAAQPADKADKADRRCLALIAYAEAAGEGRSGMAAVIQVVRNRVRDPRFPKTACAVASQAGQFQPVGEWPWLRQALAEPGTIDPEIPSEPSLDKTTLEAALALAAERGGEKDATGGALYFVNPALMDPGKCPWFARLKRTVAIGGHVFMTHYDPGEPAGEPAIDCAIAGQGRAVAAKAVPSPARKPPPLRSSRERMVSSNVTGSRPAKRRETATRSANGTLDLRLATRSAPILRNPAP